MPSPGSLLASVANGLDRGDVGAAMDSAMDEVAGTVRAWIGGGPLFLGIADPVTGGFTGTFTFDIPADAAAAFLANELSGTDVVTFRSLTRSPEPVGSLFAATAGEPATSSRWRDVIEPLQWGDELRGAVTAHGMVWGYLCLHREANEKPFTPKDRARLTALLPVLAAALQRAALGPPPPLTLGRGVLVADSSGRLAGHTGDAAAWLDELGPVTSGGLPLLLAGLVAMVLETGQPAASTITTRSGRAGFVEAARLDGRAAPEVAVVLSPAPPELRLDRLAAVTRLTPREREIVGYVLNGAATRRIAAELSIAEPTVQAHLSSVFAKTGVRSRRDLVARLRT